MPCWARLIRRRERGNSLVEMAVIAPLLVLLLTGVVDFGRAFNVYIVITNAAREGARYGARFPDRSDEIREAVKWEAAATGVTLTDSDIAIDPDPDSEPVAQAGDPIRVSVEYQFPTVLAGILGFEDIAIRASTAMMVLHSP